MTHSNLHVLHLVPSLEVGGMERLVCDMANERTQGTTSIVCLKIIGTLGKNIQSNINITALNIPNNILIALFKVCKEIWRQKPDVIHCHNLQAHFFGSLAAQICNIPKVVLTKHGTYIAKQGISTFVNKITLKKSQIVSVSVEIKSKMQCWIKDCKYPIEYIPNSISLKTYDLINAKQKSREMLGWSQNNYYIGIIARLSKPKDHALLIKAFNSVSLLHKNIKLVIVGDGPLKKKINSLIIEKKLTTQVEMLGERNDIPDILSALDLFVLTSSSEGIPMTLLEAMAARLPAICTNVGGISHVIQDNISGYLVEDGDQEGLQIAIEKVINNKADGVSKGIIGREIIEQNFSIQTMLQLYEKAYSRP